MRLRRDRRPSTRLLVVAVLLTVAAGLAGYLAGAAVKSPAEAIADTAPPGRTVLTEQVTRTRVTRSVTFDGVVQRRHVTGVDVPMASVEGAASIITRLPVQPGSRLTAGDLIAEVSGRPVLVLEGRLPAYRSLDPGATGPDVAQLQRALAEAGHSSADQSGIYGAATAAAVSALYRERGYEPRLVGTEQVDAAEEAVRLAERALQRSQAAGSDGLAVRYAREDLDRARAELAHVEQEAGAAVPLGEVVFVPALPARVTAVVAGLGQAAGGTLLTVSSGRLVVRGAPVAADARRIAKGDRARLLLTPSGEVAARVTGSMVTAAGDPAGDAGVPVGAPGRTFTIVPKEKLPARSDGTPVRVIVAVERAPSAALTVPISAVSVSAAGQDTVTVLRDGSQITVTVTPGFAGDGLVQVEPEQPAALSEGDEVVVGVGSASTSPAAS